MAGQHVGQDRLRIPADGLAVTVSVAVNVFFCALFAGFWKKRRRSRFFCRFTIDSYIKIVVIVNAALSVDKSLFFNRINCLHAKKSLHKACIAEGAKLYKISAPR